MKIAVLGAAGIIGNGIARGLADAGASLVLADLREAPLARFASEYGADVRTVDVTDVPATARLVKGADVAVNATWYYHNPKVMEACLAAGTDYLDLGGLYHTTRVQLTMDKRFNEEGLLAVLGCGKAPGITNVLAAWEAPRFDRIESVRLRSGRRTLVETDAVRLPYSPQTLFDEFTLRPVVLEDGKLREVEPLARREVIRHPEPFGAIEYVTTLHSELATLPSYLGKGVRSMDFQVALPKGTVDTVELLIRLGFASREPVTVDGRQVVPRDVAVAALATLPSPRVREVWITEVEMTGHADGGPRTAHLRATGTEAHNGTALAAIVGVDLLARRLVKAKGVHPPESALPAEAFLEGLGARGMRVSETSIRTTDLGA